MKQYLFLLLLFTSPFHFSFLHAQEVNNAVDKKGTFFFYWGYNRSRFTKSDIHFNGPNYDFTLYDVKATDRPTKFGWTYFNPSTLSIPQYNYRIGYFITNQFAISMGIDHLKYVVIPDQKTRISGVISPVISDQYAGNYLNQEITLAADLLEFEHTDGMNILTLDLEYLIPLKINFANKWKLHWNFGIGGIYVVTKTKVKILGDGLDNDFHIAGYTFTGKTGPRIEYKNRIFLLGEIKGGYASLPNVLIKNAAPESGDHNLGFLEYYIAVGVNWAIHKKKKAH